MKGVYREKSDDLVWERLLKIVREIIQIRFKARSHEEPSGLRV